MSETTPAAPPGLADRIRQAISEDGAGQSAEPPVPEVAGRITGDVPVEPSAGERRRMLFPRRANVAAIAACLVLVAGVIITSIYLPSLRPPSMISQAVAHITEQHGECVHDWDYMGRKGHYTDPEEARQKLSDHLGHEITVFDLSGLETAYQFKGGGECMLPGDQPSCHLLYIRDKSPARDKREAPYIASVFIEPDCQQFDLRQKAFDYGHEACIPGSEHQVGFFSDGELVYFVVCCDMSDLRAVEEAVEQQVRSNGGCR